MGTWRRLFYERGIGGIALERAVALDLDANEAEQVRSIARQYYRPYSEVIRAQAILLLADGLNDSEVAARLSVTRNAVGSWRRRFALDRLASLRMKPRGRSPDPPLALSDDDGAQLESMAGQYTLPHWQVVRARTVLLVPKAPAITTSPAN